MLVSVLVACGRPHATAGSAPTLTPTATTGGPTTPPGTTPAGTPSTTRTTTNPPRPTLTTTSPPAPRSFTVVGSGDILLHAALWAQGQRDARDLGESGYDFVPLLASVAPTVSAADLAVCHVESQFGPANGPFTDYPLFSVPPQIAAAIAKTGYDTCSTASNHSLDGGEAGIDRTLDALDAAGVHHAGTARSPAEAASVNLMTVKGITVAQLSYSFGFNGLNRPRGKEWLANLLDPDVVLADAHKAKQAGAQVVIVSIHWGTEYSHTPNSQQTSVAKKLLASPDIDLILGHHTHVVQPIQKIGDKWVVYGMGNEVAYQNQSPDTRDGIMPRFTFTETSPGVFRVTKAEVLPLHMWLDGKPVRLYNIAAAVADPLVPANIRNSCLASRQRTVAIVGQLGAYQAGLTVVGL